jgi:hypothetical protein
LAEEVRRIKPEELDWTPAPEMKSSRALLQEIGTMERICVAWLTDHKVLNWQDVWDSLDRGSTEPGALLSALEDVREKTLQYLGGCNEERLQTPVPLPEEWHGYFDGPSVEPEEMLRWVSRHEYYHLGQLITYRWILGDNPYKRT